VGPLVRHDENEDKLEWVEHRHTPKLYGAEPGTYVDGPTTKTEWENCTANAQFHVWSAGSSAPIMLCNIIGGVGYVLGDYSSGV